MELIVPDNYWLWWYFQGSFPDSLCWCKILAAEKHIEIKTALTGLVCKAKEQWYNNMNQSQLASDQPGSSENEITRKRFDFDILLGDEYSSKDSPEDELDPVLT